MLTDEIIEHLSYEINMFFSCAIFLIQIESNESSVNPPFLKNCLIESFAIHFRNLYEFIFEKGTDKTDLKAADIMSPENHKKWKEKRSPEITNMKNLYIRTHKEIAHLTKNRISDKNASKKTWPKKEIGNFLFQELLKMSEYADKDYLPAFAYIKKAA